VGSLPLPVHLSHMPKNTFPHRLSKKKKKRFNTTYYSCNSIHTKFHVYTQTRMADKHVPAVTTHGIPCVRCSYPFEIQSSHNVCPCKLESVRHSTNVITTSNNI